LCYEELVRIETEVLKSMLVQYIACEHFVNQVMASISAVEQYDKIIIPILLELVVLLGGEYFIDLFINNN